MDGDFVDRLDAGHHLAHALERWQGQDAVVLGMARGGVVVGFAVAEDLGLPLQALVVRKVGAPHNAELAIGAVSETGVRWLDPYIVRMTGAGEEYIQQQVAVEVEEARRRQREYAIPPGLEIVRGRTAIVVDDGIATGASALVAARSAHELGASRVVLAVPVASQQAVLFLRRDVDQVVTLATPEPFYAVGLYYRHFDQVTDDEVKDFLRQAQHLEVQQ
jgi:predicted phosphoribosyltransferase